MASWRNATCCHHAVLRHIGTICNRNNSTNYARWVRKNYFYSIFNIIYRAEIRDEK